MLLLCFFQPLYLQLSSRKWLSGSQLVSSMCEVIDKYTKDFSRVRKPIFMVGLAAGCPSKGCLSAGQGGWAIGCHGGCRMQPLGSRELGCSHCWVCQRACILWRSTEGTVMQRCSGSPPNSATFAVPPARGLPSRLSPQLVLHPAPFCSAFP